MARFRMANIVIVPIPDLPDRPAVHVKAETSAVTPVILMPDVNTVWDNRAVYVNVPATGKVRIVKNAKVVIASVIPVIWMPAVYIT